MLHFMPHPKPKRLEYRAAIPADAGQCIIVRGRTRQNAASPEWLRSIGVTPESWAANIGSGALPGHVCTVDENIIGFCFGARASGEIEVLAMLPEFENLGIGKELLARTCEALAQLGHRRLFLACSPEPSSRSYGFYRHLGWRSTETFDDHGDEILELYVDS